MSAFEKTLSAAGSVPGAIFTDVFGVVGKIVGAVERVLTSGLTEKVDARFSVFGRRIGVSCEVSLLDKKPEA
jgi:hypothetical protein